MSNSEKDNNSDSSLMHDSKSKNRKRRRQKSDKENDSDLNDSSLHIAGDNTDMPSSPKKKKPYKLSLKQRIKNLREKKQELSEFTKLPENDKKDLYRTTVNEKEEYRKKIELEKQNHEKIIELQQKQYDEELQKTKEKYETKIELQQKKYHEEIQQTKDKYEKELDAEKQKFQNERDNIAQMLNLEKEKVKMLEKQLSKITDDKSTQTELNNYAKSFTKLTSRTSIRTRLNQADAEIRKIAYSNLTENNGDEENKINIEENTTELLKKLVERYGMTVYPLSKLNAATTAFIFKHCRINVRKGRLIRKLLKTENAFASEREVNKMYAEFDKEIKIVENVIMVGENSVIVSEVENLEDMITARVQRKANNGKLLENPLDKNKLSLVFLGDDGGGSFKGGVSIGECENQNSPENFTPVVVVSGKTNKEIIYASCERIAAKLEKIKTITVKIDGEDRVFETEWSLGGDYQFDLHCCGRKSAGSNCYCIWCRFKRRTRLFKDPTSLERGETRQNFDQLSDDDGYDSPPLFKNIPPFFVLLPLLHIFLGIGLLFINAIEEILKQFDYEVLTPQEREAYEQDMLEKDKQINDTKKALELLENTVEEKTQIVETIHDIIDLKLTKEEMDKSIKGCCMEFCCERVGYEAGEIRYCVCCKKKPQGYHQLCLGTLRSKTQIKCNEVQKYEKAGGLLSNIQKIIKQHEKELETSIGKKRKVEMKLDGLFMKKFDEFGPNMKEYNEFLMELNVTKQAWYQTFTGNHMRLLLKRADIFSRLTAIAKSSKLQHLVKALSLLKKIQDYTEARYLKENEIANLKADVENIKNHMKENLGDFSVIPKFHILIHHVVEIAELRKTIGLFTEQQIEHVHALFNTELRRAKFLRKQKRNSWMMKEMYRRNAMKDAFGSLADANYN